MNTSTKIRYAGGQVIPNNVISTLKFLGKVGLLTTAQWHAHFGYGNLRWRQRQLKSLVDKKFIRRHQNAPDGNWVLNSQGRKILERLEINPVVPVPSQDLLHDSFVGNSLVQLEKAGLCTHWLTGNELKRRGGKDFQIQGKDQKVMYPDALLQVKVDRRTCLMAIHYERVSKTTNQYRSILSQYSSFRSLDLILYITEDEQIRRRILAAQKHLGSIFLQTRLGLVNAQEWENAPELARITLGSRTLTLDTTCEKTA